ncbi:MAG: class I SAM-dependent methyltransferase [Thermoflexales bacterium]|nr:class I SAM-dependent methyltransferase [Thermoflexales bacterium]
MDSNTHYQFLSRFYDIFDVIFWFWGKGSPRCGLPAIIRNDPMQVLDICVGTASSALLLAGHNPRNTITGIDLSPDMLAVAQRKIGSEDYLTCRCAVRAQRTWHTQMGTLTPRWYPLRFTKWSPS